MGLEKDGIIIKTNKERKTYGIASGLDINIPMLTLVKATIVNMMVVFIEEEEKDNAVPSTSGQLNSCYYYVCTVTYNIIHILSNNEYPV